MSTNFYVTGGTMLPDAPSYIKRQADDELYHALKQGEYCYILDSSQMGKSSLVIRVKERLKQEGIKVIYFSLQPSGTTDVTLDNWYGTLLTEIDKELELPTTASSFWNNQRQQNLTPTYCWGEVVRQIILGHCSQPIVFFLDEIGMVKSLPAFTDDFLLSLREFYNARATHPDLCRLTFCLIGTATPASLIKDRHLPPFNVGQRIILADFTETEVTSSLADGLQHKGTTAITLLQRVWYWTNGHPYLTQKLCEEVAKEETVTKPKELDKLCRKNFVESGSHDNMEHSKSAVRSRLLTMGDQDKFAYLDLYRKILRGNKIPHDERNPSINELRLSGLVRVQDNYLKVRNRIYSQVFNKTWITANMPDAAKAEYRRGLMEASLPAIVIIGAMGGGIYWYLDWYVLKHVTYCNTYAKRFGIMQCVGELSTAQAHGREVSYKFIRKGRKNPVWKVQAVKGLSELVNSEFTKKLLESLQQDNDVVATPPAADETLTSCHNVEPYLENTSRWYNSSPQISQWEFVLDANGKIVHEKANDWDNKLVWGLVYSPSLEGQPKRVHYTGASGLLQSPTDSGAESVEFRYSAQGDEEEVRYFDRQGNLQLGPSKVFIKRQQFDERGLSTEERYFDSDGKAMLNEDGYHQVAKKYDDLGQIIEQTYFGKDKQAILLKEGYHRVTKTYDNLGKVIEKAYFGVDGQPILGKDGYHKVTKKYDDRDNEEAYFGIDGQPILGKDGYHKVTKKYDDRDNEEAYFGIDGQPILLKDGYHKVTKKYDNSGKVIEQAFFGIDGQPILGKDDYHKLSCKYDVRSKVIESAAFGLDEQPILDKDGFHKVTNKYDDRGNIIELALFGLDGQPILDKNGYHKVTSKYDDHGNVIEQALFGLDAQPILHKDGYHKVTSKYDDRGKVIETAYFGIDGQPILHKDGYHKVTWKYDNYVYETAYFGIDGQPILHKDGYHKLTNKYDDRGNLIEQSLFGLDGQPILLKVGYHKHTSKYDDSGNITEDAYFGIEGQPILSKDGYHKVTSKYDDRGNVIEQALFGIDGQPIFDKGGYHKWTKKYNDRGNVIEEAYFDVAGNLIRGSSKQTGEADTTMVDATRAKGQYNERDQLISQAYFDELGNPTTLFGLHSFTQKYDEQGDFLEVAYFDIAGRPTLFKDGYHKFTKQKDKSRNQIEWAYFEVEGKPTTSKLDGYHKLQERSNERGLVLESTYFDIAGNYYNEKYDAHSNQIYQASFDALGNPTTTTNGFHKLTATYDDKGNQIEIAYFDVTGRPLTTEVVVTLITPDSQAEKLGIQVGDIFTHYDGRPVINLTNFFDRYYAEPTEGMAKELKVLREGKELILQVSPGELGVELENRMKSK